MLWEIPSAHRLCDIHYGEEVGDESKDMKGENQVFVKECSRQGAWFQATETQLQGMQKGGKFIWNWKV